MHDLIILFKVHIENIFDPGAKFTSDGISKIRVKQPNRRSVNGFRHSRSVVLIFDKDVIEAFAEAKDQNLDKVITSYKYSLRKLIISSMNDYDPDGDRNTAFQICVDSRATDF